MAYKKKIDELRLYKKIIESNLSLICDDMMFFDDKLESLLEEHRYYSHLLKQTDSSIRSLQPWYKKLLEILY